MSRASKVLAILGSALIATYAIIGLVVILWLDPLAAVPGTSIEEIHSRMSAARDPSDIAGALIFVAVGLVLAGSLVVLALLRRVRSARVVAALALGVLALGAPAFFAAGFFEGFSVAETFGVSGGDHTPWAIVLYLASAASIGGLVALGLSYTVGMSSGRASVAAGPESDTTLESR